MGTSTVLANRGITRTRLGGLPTLSGAEAFWKAGSYSGSGALKDLSGRGHDAAFPGGSNDPLWLPYTGEQYLYLPGVAGNYASTPDAAALSVTGDLDIRIAVAMDDWTPAAISMLLAKSGAAGTRSFYLDVKTDGTFRFVFSTDGTTESIRTSTAAPVVSNGALLLIRATIDVDNGASGHDVKYWTKASTEATVIADLQSDADWVQLGATVTTAGTVSIFDGAAPVTIGMYGDGNSNPLAGKVYGAVIKSGIAGTTESAPDFTDTTNLVEPFATYTDPQARVWTFNRSASGRKAAVVERPLFLFGTDDYLEVPDADGLDFAAADSLTIVAAVRIYGTGTAARILSKRTAGTVGYMLQGSEAAGTRRPNAFVGDGTDWSSLNGSADWSDGVVVALGNRFSRPTNTLAVFRNGVKEGEVSNALIDSLANSEPLAIGAYLQGPAYGDFEFLGAAIFRRALTDTEILTAGTELVTR